MGQLITYNMPPKMGGWESPSPSSRVVSPDSYRYASDPDDTLSIQRALAVALDRGMDLLFTGRTYDTNAGGWLIQVAGGATNLAIFGERGAKIRVADKGISVSGVAKVIIKDLVIERKTQAQWQDVIPGIEVNNGDHATIQGNEVSGFVDGISTNNLTNSFIIGNICHHLGEEPIVVRHGVNVVVSDNEGYMHLGDGILVKQSVDITIVRNKLHNPVNKNSTDPENVALWHTMTDGKTGAVPARGGGITCNSEGGESVTVNMTIDDNRIDSCGYGIGPLGITSMKVTNNRISNTTSAAGIGVYGDSTFNPNLNPATELIIAGNIIENLLHPFQVDGIAVKMSNDIVIDRAIIANNIVIPNGPLHCAIRAVGNVIVDGNIVRRYFRGIELSQGAIANNNIILEEYPGTLGRALTLSGGCAADGNKIASGRQVDITGNDNSLTDNLINYTGNYWAVFVNSGCVGNDIIDNKITVTVAATGLVGGADTVAGGASSNWDDVNVYEGELYRSAGARYVRIARSINKGSRAERLTGPEDGRVDGSEYYDTDLGDKVIFNRTKQLWIEDNCGTSTFNGNGSQTDFQLLHGLALGSGQVPTYYTATAASVDAGNAGIAYVYANEASIHVVFKTAPIAGTGNVKVTWRAKNK